MKSNYCLWKKMIQHLNRSACALVGICVLMLFVVSGPAAVSQELLKDVNPDGLYSDGVEYGEAVDRDGILFFVSHSELWRTNGTPQGTVKLREFENILYLTNVAGVIYFLVIDTAQGKFQLWKSNGASYNTVKVTDIGPYSDSIWPSNFLAVGNRLFFVGYDGVSGQELWTSDGTGAGTRMVKDIMVKGGSSNPSHMAASNGLVYFSANDGINGYELWKSDGTPDGTVMVKDIRPGSRLSSSPKLITDVNGVVFFTAADGVSGTELWKSDGTAGGTTMVKEIIAGSGNTPIHNLTNVNGTLFFSAADGIHGEELWKSNGTASGTIMVKDLYPGKIGSTAYRPTRNFTNLNGVLYFTANSSREEYSFWKSDGTEAGTINLGPSDGPGYDIINPHYVYMNGYAYFFNGANTGSAYRVNLLREDGNGNVSIVTTVLLSDMYFDNAPMLVKSKNVLYFVGKPSFPETHALYKTNGTAAGTQLVADTYRPFRPNDFVRIGTTMYFTSRSARSENLWKTDGTSEGTSLVATGMRYIDETVALDEIVYFTGGVQKPDGFFWDIYRSDGTPAGTVPLNFKGGKNTLPIQKLVTEQDKIFFVNNYTDLWVFNGAFTFLTKITYPNKLSACGSKLYFYSSNTSNGGELWSTDGTLAGTGMVKDINPNGSSAIDKLTCLNTTLFLSANDGVHGHELWRSNGTSGGTLMVKDVRTGDATNINLNDIGDVLASNGAVYFTSKNTATSFSLWKSNGTEGGTTLLGNVGVPVRLMDGQQRIYFVSNDNGVYSLWKSEGTPATTQILLTFNENPYASNEPTYTTVNNIFYGGFTLNLLASDGTTCGTKSYYMFVGPGPYPLSNLGETLLFGGSDTFVGHEVFTAGSSYYYPGCSVSAQASSQATLMEENEVITLYPNPFHDHVSVYVKGGNQYNDYSATITDMNGRQIEFHEKLDYDVDNQIGAGVPPGMYLLEINEHGKTTIGKVIKN
jgi:ELWxxDGT repeat protein